MLTEGLFFLIVGKCSTRYSWFRSFKITTRSWYIFFVAPTLHLFTKCHSLSLIHFTWFRSLLNFICLIICGRGNCFFLLLKLVQVVIFFSKDGACRNLVIQGISRVFFWCLQFEWLPIIIPFLHIEHLPHFKWLHSFKHFLFLEQ